MAPAPSVQGAAVARMLWQVNAVRVSVTPPFTLASGKLSPLYINCRALISYPRIMAGITARFEARWLALGLGLDEDDGTSLPWVPASPGIAGGESAGIPFAAFLAAKMSLPMYYVRKAAKGYGTNVHVEGATITPGAPIVLVEDLITDGESKLGFIHALRNAGAVVEHCFVVCDRLQGGREVLAGADVTLTTLTDIQTILMVGVERNLITTEQMDAVQVYLLRPDDWPLS